VTSAPDARLLVPSRFNGPPGSANGGYVAGLLAAHVPTAGPVRVTLREPPPLEVPMVVLTEDGLTTASFGGAVIATAEPGQLGNPVDPVPFDVAARAESRYAGLRAHPFPGCFVCGPDRPAGDGLGLRPGRIAADAMSQADPVDPDKPEDRVATTWVPDASVAGPDGAVPPELVWAALDCPGGWSSDLVARPMVLGRMTAAVQARPLVGDRCVVVGRVLGSEGRKTFSASTAYDSDGRVLGHAESTWIALR
jgi:hypothetical protein